MQAPAPRAAAPSEPRKRASDAPKYSAMDGGLRDLQSPPGGATTIPKRVVVATVAANAIEFFDFLVYSFFAVYIGKAFFPASSEYVSLLTSVAVFGVGFVF